MAANGIAVVIGTLSSDLACDSRWMIEACHPSNKLPPMIASNPYGPDVDMFPSPEGYAAVRRSFALACLFCHVSF